MTPQQIENLKRNVELLRDWNGENGSKSNIEFGLQLTANHLITGWAGIDIQTCLYTLVHRTMRLTRECVASMFPGYDATEWVGYDNGYYPTSDHEIQCGWLLKKKQIRGCHDCELKITTSRGNWAGCERDIDKACGAPDWPCYIAAEEGSEAESEAESVKARSTGCVKQRKSK